MATISNECAQIDDSLGSLGARFAEEVHVTDAAGSDGGYGAQILVEVATDGVVVGVEDRFDRLITSGRVSASDDVVLSQHSIAIDMS